MNWSAKRLLTLLAVCTIVTLIAGCGKQVSENIKIGANQTVIKKGVNLANGLAACGFCHGFDPKPFSPLAGGRENYDIYGAIKAPNITPSRSGIGHFKDDQIISSIRGVWVEKSDKRSPNIHRGYEWMSTSDVVALVAYLRSVTPIKNEVEQRRVGFTARNTTGLFSKTSVVQGFVSEIPPTNKAYVGKYLVNHVARCGFCHNTEATVFNSEVYLGGNQKAPALIGDSSFSRKNEKEIKSFFKQGVYNGKKVNSDLCPTDFFANTDPDQIDYIVEYLKTLS